ncbi:lipoprotein [Mucilaginibacter sp.]|uniref:lipoprotein n=1 Tax=Mucilaginibacter sp. TaxID=1882438 RepID=UPI003B00627A
MKKLLLFAFAAATLASCQKSGIEGNPSSSTVSTENYTALNIKTSTQVVKVAVDANVLNLIYNEDVTLIADSGKLNSNWAIHLKEDFTGTQLADYHYNSMTKFGVNAADWVDDNLNNVIIRSSKDTLINNKLFVKKRIVRTFVYKQSYNSAAEAVKVQNRLINTTDIIAFTAYFASIEMADTHSNSSNTAKLIYVKN